MKIAKRIMNEVAVYSRSELESVQIFVQKQLVDDVPEIKNRKMLGARVRDMINQGPVVNTNAKLIGNLFKKSQFSISLTSIERIVTFINKIG